MKALIINCSPVRKGATRSGVGVSVTVKDEDNILLTFEHNSDSIQSVLKILKKAR